MLNALMFGVELAASFSAQSVALLADAVDFLGDAGNYAVALFVLGLAPVALAHRAVEGLADGRLRHLRARQRTAGRTL